MAPQNGKRLLGLVFCVHCSTGPADEIVVDKFRVQALTPTLLRVEPEGPKGFEDGTTFMVQSRDFQGVAISKKGETNETVTLTTKFYDVVIEKGNSSPSQGSCAMPVAGQDYDSTTRSHQFPNGLQASNEQSCCDACESDTTCVGWVYDADGKHCWPLADFSGPRAGARQSACASGGCSLSLTCSNVEGGKDASAPARSSKYSEGAMVSSRDECCNLCNNDPSCVAFIHASSDEDLAQNAPLTDVDGANCWPLSHLSGTVDAHNREVGHSTRTLGGPEFLVLSPSGDVLYDTKTDTWKATGNLLHWPSPLSQPSYALADYPRFFVPEWGTVPIPDGEHVDPELVQTNGYDFRNNVPGDTYVFLLGSDLDSYQASRSEFLKLAGECPVLPDFAFGTWYTAWAQYTYDSATEEIKKWEELNLPLSIWALDMNWRDTDNHKDRYYDNPNTKLFPNFTQWFEFLQEHKLHTYFNDHPFPVQDRDAGGGQCSPEETAFRWDGLSSWMEKGLGFWWFDHNWGFSIPPPFVDNGGKTDGNWLGLDNAAWGSHVYFNAVSYYNKNVRDPAGDTFNGGRPMTLTKFGLPDWRPGMDAKGHAESPAQHRFPVWWTGDGVNLQASIESMVDAGVHGFKPFVHSDCGGDYKPTAGDFLRWSSHCSYGSIQRYHDAGAGAHHPWDYDDHVLNVTRNYLNARSKLTPSIIAAAQKASSTGHPYVARCDLFWPEHSESSSNQQYMFLDDILVAPIWDAKENETSRSVWVPPGDWEDAWDGSVITGPKTITVTQPFERMPMWHKRDGGFIVVADEPAQRVEDQDWSSLTLELFPASGAGSTHREVFERGSAERTELAFHTDGQGKASVEIGHGSERAWTVRIHMLPGQHLASASVDGDRVGLRHHAATREVAAFFPLGGAGAPSAPQAGPVAEVIVPRGSFARIVEMEIAVTTLV